MISDKPTVTDPNPSGYSVIILPLEHGYSIEIDQLVPTPTVTLLNAKVQKIYTQPWRTDAIRNCMDAMVRNECATQSELRKEGDET